MQIGGITLQITHPIPSTLEVELAMVVTILLGPPLHHLSKTAIWARDQWEPAELTNWIWNDAMLGDNVGAVGTLKPSIRPSTSR